MGQIAIFLLISYIRAMMCPFQASTGRQGHYCDFLSTEAGHWSPDTPVQVQSWQSHAAGGFYRTLGLCTRAAPAGRRPCQLWLGHQQLSRKGHSRFAGAGGRACQTPGSPPLVCWEGAKRSSRSDKRRARLAMLRLKQEKQRDIVSAR